MDLQKLKENVVTKDIDFLGEKITLDIQPYAEYVPKEKDFSDFDFIVAKLKAWNLELNGSPIEITKANLSEPVMPAELFKVILDAVLAVKRAPLGKLEVLTI